MAGTDVVTCDLCGKQLLSRNLPRHKRKAHPESVPVKPDDVLPPGDELGHPDEASPAGPRPPAAKGGGGFKWPWSHDGKPRAERRRRSRESTASLWEFLWDQGGAAAVASGADPPVGRVMQWQAPWIGEAIEEEIRGTILDPIVQPLARMQAHGEKLQAIVGPLVLTALLERNPDAIDVLEPLLKACLRPMFVQMVKAAKVQQAEERELVAAAEDVAEMLPPELAELLGKPGRTGKPMGPEDALIALIFSPLRSTEGGGD